VNYAFTERREADRVASPHQAGLHTGTRYRRCNGRDQGCRPRTPSWASADGMVSVAWPGPVVDTKQLRFRKHADVGPKKAWTTIYVNVVRLTSREGMPTPAPSDTSRPSLSKNTVKLCSIISRQGGIQLAPSTELNWMAFQVSGVQTNFFLFVARLRSSHYQPCGSSAAGFTRTIWGRWRSVRLPVFSAPSIIKLHR
jgi:hypothetical protein